jgi:uncharacterized protein
MKPSIFNLCFPLEENNRGDRYGIYNALHGSIFEVDGEGRNALEGKTPFDDLPPDVQGLLKDNGIFVEDNIDELRLFKVKFDDFKYDKRSLLFTLITSYECNLDCPYCYESRPALPEIGLTLEGAEIIIKFITQKTVQFGSRNLSFYLFGGEPLLKPEPGINIARILKAWAESNKISFNLGLVTNATLLTSGMISSLSEFGNVFTQITLDGPQEVHDKKRVYKTGGGTYRDILAALQRCRRANFDVKIRINVDKDNVKDIPRMLDDLIRSGLGGLRLTFCALSPLTRACAHYLSYLDTAETTSLIPGLWETALNKGFLLDIAPKATPVYCGSATDSAYVIDPFLDVYKCYASVGIKEHRVGYLDADGGLIKEYPYYDLLSRDPLDFKDQKCLHCKLLPTCGGGCALDSHKTFGSYHHGRCDFFSRIIEQRMQLYLKYRDRLDPEGRGLLGGP